MYTLVLFYISKTKRDPVFDFTGGRDTDGTGETLDTILRYNPSTDTWTEVGRLTETKNYHASSSVVDYFRFKDVCP